MRNGNSVNSTNFPICLSGGWIGVIQLLKSILINFQRRGLHWSCGMSPFPVFTLRPHHRSLLLVLIRLREHIDSLVVTTAPIHHPSARPSIRLRFSSWDKADNRFIAFIAGSFAAILLSASLIDPDLFLHFEITPHRTVLFYLGVFGSILAIARGMVPEENLVFDPEATLKEVVWWTHYLPGEWRGKLHSKMVRISPLPFFTFAG